MSGGPALRSFAELAALRRVLQRLREQEAARRQAEREAAERAWAERHLFEHAVGRVEPLKHRDARHACAPPRPAPLPVQRLRDEREVLLQSLSDEFDVSTLLDVDDQMSFRRPGTGLDVTRKLRAGHWSIQSQLDLHGLRRDEAREALAQFIRRAHRSGLRCVRIVHGKGLGSPGRVPVLKGRVQSWLVQKREVLAFVQARAAEGGAGALIVLLQPGHRKK
ncbi:MAG: Smr/MutS family protein [Burkholderiales bacterium]|nr:Smr/MutS family protein [Burkholderiales bacterium]